MDDIKEKLALVKPYTFWIACSVILLACLATWYMSTGTLHQQREENYSKVKSAFSALNALKVKAVAHPNPTTIEGMAQLTRAYGTEIAAGWDVQYKRQADVLVWPSTFDQDFHEAVKDLRPIEKVPVATPIQLTIPDSLRRRYRDFIEDELPKLATSIGGKWHARRDPAGEAPSQQLGPDGRPMGEIDKSIVLWAPEDQRAILEGHFGFTALADDPSTLDVLYAQEDLWVLQNLMEIIKRTNEGAEGRHDAAVKQIEFVRIGKSALGHAGQVMAVGTSGPGGTGEGQPYPAAGTGGQPVEGQPDGQAPVAAPPVSPTQDPEYNPQDPGNWRYVDQNNLPLAGFQLRAALTAPTELNALLAVAKRVPVRLRFEIDQRKLNKLLAAFGNAPLPVEVRQLRINRPAAGIGSLDGYFTAGGAGAGGAMPGVMPGGGRGEGGFSGGMTQPGRGYGEGPSGFNPTGPGGGSITRDATIDTNLITLELYGIVYLYNPVNRGVLQLEATSSPTAMTTTESPEISGG